MNCDFREANLNTADFSAAVLSESIFGEASLMATDLREAVMQGARELTPLQLSQARTSYGTILPNGTKGPYVKGFGSELAPKR